MEKKIDDQIDAQQKARREFLAKCGRFAAVTPPAMAFLLSTTAQSEATGRSPGAKKKRYYYKKKKYSYKKKKFGGFYRRNND